MDEEQKSNIDPIAEILQRPKQKINVDSFFNRTDDAESITAISLKLASVIEQIDVMRTEIKEIATYITVEHKIEKDLREDRLFEEQDAKQKKEMRDRALARGEKVPKDKGDPAPEERKGGFFSGLMKLVGGLALGAGLIALAPLILKGLLIAGGATLLGFLISKIAPPIVNFVRDLGPKTGEVFGGLLKGTLGRVPLIGKPVSNFADKISGKLGESTGGIADSLQSKFDNIAGGGTGGNSGGGGTSSGPTSGGNMNLEENNAGNDMANTLEEKGVIKDTRNFGDNYKEQEEYFASDEYKQSFDKEVEEVEEVKSEKTDGVEELEKGNIPKTYRGVQVVGREWDDIRKDMEEAKIAMAEIMKLQKRIFSGKLRVGTEKNADSKLLNAYQKKIDEADKFFGTEKFDPEITGIKQGVTIEVDDSGKILNPEVVVPSFQFQNSNENPNLSMNNTSVVVPKNEPQVSSAEIKVTGTTLAYARALQNPYLSITNKKIPPELSRIG